MCDEHAMGMCSIVPMLIIDENTYPHLSPRWDSQSYDLPFLQHYALDFLLLWELNHTCWVVTCVAWTSQIFVLSGLK